MIDPSFGLTLWQVLGGFLALAVCMRNRQMAGVAALLLIDWAACTYLVFDDPSGGIYAENKWILRCLYDWLTAMVILWRLHKSRFSFAIVGLYIFETICHLTYGGSLTLGRFFEIDRLAFPSVSVQATYWDCLHWGAWLQAWCLLIWIARDALRLVGSDSTRDSYRYTGREVRHSAFRPYQETPDLLSPSRVRQ